MNLAQNLENTSDTHEWVTVPIEDFLKRDEVAKAVSELYSAYCEAIGTSFLQNQISRKPQYSLLFSVPETSEE